MDQQGKFNLSFLLRNSSSHVRVRVYQKINQGFPQNVYAPAPKRLRAVPEPSPKAFPKIQWEHTNHCIQSKSQNCQIRRKFNSGPTSALGGSLSLRQRRTFTNDAVGESRRNAKSQSAYRSTYQLQLYR